MLFGWEGSLGATESNGSLLLGSGLSCLWADFLIWDHLWPQHSQLSVRLV